MTTKRPKIKVPLEPLDIMIDLLSITILIVLTVYTVTVFSKLPDTIPTHFNFKGEADSFGNKSTLFMLPIIGIVLFVLLYVLNKFPHIHNNMVNITEANALKNYRFSTRIVRFTNLFVAIIFAFVQYMMVQAAQGKRFSLGEWFVPTIIAVSFIVPIALVIYQYKMNN